MSGGCLCTSSNYLKIVNTTIDSNTATSSGREIYTLSAAVPANADINCSTVSRNTATCLRGCVYLNASDPARAVYPSVRAGECDLRREPRECERPRDCYYSELLR